MTLLGWILWVLCPGFLIYLVWRKKENLEGETILKIFISILAFIFGSLVWVGLVFLMGAICGNFRNSNTHEVESDYVYISSISNGKNVSGNFVLGCGSVDEKEYFYYYKKVGNFYQLDKLLNTQNVFIQEGIMTPCIEHKYRAPKAIIGFVKIFVNDPFVFKTSSNIIIHVPPNTVIEQYILDTNKL